MVYTMKDLTGIIIRMEEYLQIQRLSNITAHGGMLRMERLIFQQERSVNTMVPGGMYQAVR